MANTAASKAKGGKSRARSTSKGSNAKAKVISSRTMYRGPVFWITRDKVQEPGGVRAYRDIVHHTGSVVVLAVEDSRSSPRVLLERQYRHAAQDYLWELPAGGSTPVKSRFPRPNGNC